MFCFIIIQFISILGTTLVKVTSVVFESVIEKLNLTKETKGLNANSIKKLIFEG